MLKPRKVIIERTSKRWKALGLLSYVVFFLGILMFAGGQQIGPVAFTVVMIAIGMSVVATIGRWWTTVSCAKKEIGPDWHPSRLKNQCAAPRVSLIRASEALVQSNFGLAFRTTINGAHSKRPSCFVSWHLCEKRLLAARIAIWTYLMLRFSSLSQRFQNISKSVPEWLQFVSLLFSIPCFKVSHFFFKRSYALQQLRLRRLCNEEFFLQFYDRRIATGSIVNVLQSLREVERGLKGAEASKSFPYHVIRS